MDKSRYLPHLLSTRYDAVVEYRKTNNKNYICRKYHISRVALWRWNKRFDGTKESLKDKSHKPHSIHPNAHTNEELKHIKDLIKRNPNITLNEIWYKLKTKYSYTRQPTSLYRVLRRLNFYKMPQINHTSKKYNGKYPQLLQLGQQWQIDVKYVPKECKVENLLSDTKFYQYTCIDVTSRERYLYWYEEKSATNTQDFVKRCIRYFGYQPQEIQTDNGTEFTHNRAKTDKIHPMDSLLNKLHIRHHKIPPYTPEHNGKVERSHRNDNERFYSYLKFYSLEDLRRQGAKYVTRSNRIPMRVLHYLTPVEKRKQLLLPVIIPTAS